MIAFDFFSFLNRDEQDRFPDVACFCGYCNAYLNDQEDFDDHKYIWECQECGYKSSISSNNILDD